MLFGMLGPFTVDGDEGVVPRAAPALPADRSTELEWPWRRRPASASAAPRDHARRLRLLFGRPGAGHAIEVAERERFRRHHRSGLAARRSERRPGRAEDLPAELRAPTVRHARPEAAQGQLAAGRHRSARPDDAPGAYQRVRDVPRDGPRAEPGSRPAESRRHVPLRDGDRDRNPAGPERPAAAVRPPRAPAAVPAHWPGQLGELVGRSGQLASLEAWLRSTGGQATALPVTVLVGVGGVGKTALARHAALRAADRFPDGVLHADLRGSGPRPAAAGEVLAGLLRDLGVRPGSVPGGTGDRAACLRSLVARRRVLIVLDDAASAGQLAPLLSGAGRTAVLVTSRTRTAGPVHARRITVDGLPDPDATRLLTRVVGDRRAGAEPQAVRRVVELCEGLPLALRIAGLRLAARPSWPIAAFAGLLADDEHRLDALTAGHLNVRDGLLASYHRLAERSPSGSAAARIFRLTALWNGPDLAPPAVAALADLDEPACATALEELVDSHLLRPTGPGRYGPRGLPRLLARELVRTEDGPAVRAEALHRLLSWYHRTADAAANALDGRCPGSVPGRAVSSPRRALSFALPDQALSWQRAEHANLIAAVRQVDQQGHHCFGWLSTTALHGPHDERTVRLISLGRYEEAMARARRLAAEGVRSGRWRQVAAARSSLAEALRLTGRYRAAEPQAASALALAESLGDPGLTVALGLTLGRIHCAYQDTDRALGLFRAAWEVAARAHEDAAAARCLEAIGDVHASRGEMDAAGAAWGEAGASPASPIDGRRAWSS